ncbi:hypothetical protein [Serratia liquefaciens]|uniref:hypothetical protein n=1 Tax=Serratia liquefaciens TaxID=614 RepID=UPI00301B7D6B
MIKRFNPDFSLSISHELAYMRETPEGGYVAHGDYATLFSELEVVKAERDALAVENAALKARTVTIPAKVYVKDMRCNVVRWAQVIDAISDAGVAFVRDDGELIAGTRETPATDAALAAIEARGVEKALAVVSACRENICPGGLSENRQYEESIVHPHLDGISDELEALAAELREAK